MPETVLDLLHQAPEYASLLDGLKKDWKEQTVYGLSGSLKSYLAAALRGETGRPCLMVTSTIQQAEKLRDDLATWLPTQETLLFPPMEYLPFEVVAHSPEVIAARLRVLERLARGEDLVVVAPVAALMRRLTPRSVFAQSLLTLKRGDRVHLEELLTRLVRQGYERVDMVEGKGQFSVRGGIADIYPLASENPVRIELWDDEVDQIRRFDAASQRSIEQEDSVFLGPAREFILPPTGADEAARRIRHDLDVTAQRLKRHRDRKLAQAALEKEEAHQALRGKVLGEPPPLFDSGSTVDKLRERVEGHLEKLEQGIYFEGLEHYASFFYDELDTILDYFGRPPLVMVDEPARIREATSELQLRDEERQVGILEKGGLLPGQLSLYLNYLDLFSRLRRHNTIYFSLLLKKIPGSEPQNAVSVVAKPMQEFHGQWPLFLEELGRWRAQKYRVIIYTATAERSERLRASLLDSGVESALVAPHDPASPVPGTIAVAGGTLEQGFQWPGLRLVLVTDGEIYGRPKKLRRTNQTTAQSAKEGARLLHYQDLKVGDYVVHATHGIGKYLGARTETILGATRDYLVIQYEGADRLKIPTDQIDQIQKYIGAEGHEPRINKLGGAEWQKIKHRVKESIREMAAELLRLQAVREAVPGHPFSPDSVWQHEFEDAFPYEETPDQLQASEEIKRDMERPRPMDRLLLGDVGYGKTEVALRAAFKAVTDSKQVAVLVPTTILAQQHYTTCLQRFSGFPITVEVLNRFRTPKEQAEITQRLSRGEIDLVIGTHRILGDDIRFKELGLLVVDEEQRFGVQHKEKLKQLRTTVDVLTLSATPIPRTLHMSMVGLRDMSVITSPPEDRFPVETYVAEYDEELIRDAIGRELHRGGQVYFVHNRVQTIEKVAARIQELVPEARVVIAHGQMKEDRLEQVMLDFLEGEYDVLCATTIIESGLDIPMVNTIVVDDADHLGLAQLYQLRGRVGRSNRLAYAYFLYKRDKVLTEVAEKRLQAIKDFTELGSGYKIAMRDMEIRGAGNILGPEQHGFIISVGFDMYCQLLEEAAAELKGQPVVREVQPSVELTVDAYISDQYIHDARQKIEAYKRIITIKNKQDAADVAEELEDRYGTLPQPVQNLLALARIKGLAAEAGLLAISQTKDRVTFKFPSEKSIPHEALAALQRKYRGRISLGPPRQPSIVLRVTEWQPADLLLAVEDIIPNFQELSTARAGWYN